MQLQHIKDFRAFPYLYDSSDGLSALPLLPSLSFPPFFGLLLIDQIGRQGAAHRRQVNLSPCLILLYLLISISFSDPVISSPIILQLRDGLHQKPNKHSDEP